MTKNNRIAARVISMILGVLMGVALVIFGSVVKVETLVWLALVIWGVIVAVSNIPGLIYAVANLKAKGAIFDLVASIIGILLGIKKEKDKYFSGNFFNAQFAMRNRVQWVWKRISCTRTGGLVK